MSQWDSKYDLVPGDCYYTPAWVTEALLRVEEFPEKVWEPACGGGHIADVLRAHNKECWRTDIMNDYSLDFLSTRVMHGNTSAIITNPPYSHGLADKFVRHALDLTGPISGKVAMLLPLAWDSAGTRRDLFAENPAFTVKFTLTKRIRWANLQQKKDGPRFNHAWFVWDWENATGHPPILSYLP